MILLRDLFCRLRRNWRWVLGQFFGTGLIVAAGLAWTRLPDKHAWQVALSLIVPMLLAICVLELQAGTMRALADDDGKRVRLIGGALSLAVWIAAGALLWCILDWCDDRIPLWAGYLNSKAWPHARATWLSYEHLTNGMGYAEWVLRWIVVPGKLMVLAAASAQWGWRFRPRLAMRVLLDWRWWSAVIPAALVAVALPAHLFSAVPGGAVSAQVWRVSLKLAAAYVLAIGCWVVLLGWVAVLFAAQPEPAPNAWDERLLSRFSLGRKWIAAMFGWLALSIIVDLVSACFPGASTWLSILAAIVLVPSAIVVSTLLMRSYMTVATDPVRLIWGVLSVLLWAAAGLALALALSLWYHPVAQWFLGWMVAPALLLPLAAASAVWGLRLPWRRVLKMPLQWRWWLGVLLAAVAGVALPALISAVFTDSAHPEAAWDVLLRSILGGALGMGSWVMVLGWLAVQLDESQPRPTEEDPTPAPVLAGPTEGARRAAGEVPREEELSDD